MKHLQAETWRKLCAGLLDAEQARYWAEHLQAGCETCELHIADFAQQGETDPLDGYVDEALFSDELAGPQSQSELDQLGFARLQKTLRHRRWSRRLAGLGAVAAVIAGLSLFWPGLFSATNPVKTWHTKGVDSSLSCDLQLVQVEGNKLSTIRDNSHLVVGDKLAFHFILQQDACVQLALQRASEHQALLDNFKCFKAGSHSLQNQGQALAYQLEQAGKISFYLKLKDAHGRTGESPHLRLQVGAKPADRLP